MELIEKLQKPFMPEEIEWRAGATNADKTKALALAYITSRAVMNRLDETVGIENWKDTYEKGPDGGVLCGLSIRVGNEWVTKYDGAENTDFEGVKGGLSDALKRAAVKWGIGRYLYQLDGVWVACEQRGKSVILKQNPSLPAWALPEGITKQQPATQQKPVSHNTPEITLDEAMAIVGSDGKAYGDCSDKELDGKRIGISNALNKGKLNAKQQDDHLRKLAAVNLIINARLNSANQG